MIGLDTNIIVRYLTRDDETQWKQASQLIRGGEQCFITNISQLGVGSCFKVRLPVV
ncbi:hypothetical protein Ple7327_0462 [Pleurocapsa sp. PCC 7327]|nr:hypothetical protein [Pleurocapsa sp. PCC 7327]AFY75918.1 hypothetical protein Ple7327_0462 [Pleurocapsa sp. PCC 7327]